MRSLAMALLGGSAALCLLATAAGAEVKIEKVNYKGWPNCYKLSNGTVELIVTTDVGPRVIRYGFPGEDNLFAEFEDQLGKTGGDEWRIYGGHRLWHAPEAKPRSYFPDNVPVKVDVQENGIRLVAPEETTTRLQKEIEITLDPTGSHVTVRHRIRNNGLFPVEFAPWALTVMNKNGRAIFPREPYRPHPEALLPVNQMVVWAYTDLSDPRWYWGKKFIMLKQDPSRTEPQKLGLGNKQGWMAYSRGNHLFLKRYIHRENAVYPDMGCSTETFTNGDMLELETLGPLTKVEPEGVVEHVEHWFLYKGVELGDTEDSIERALTPILRETARLIRPARRLRTGAAGG
jgi:hypothetical protein